MELIDTSNWVHFLRKSDPNISARVKELIAEENAAICPIIAAELWNGVRNDDERKAIEKVHLATMSFGISEEVWRKSFQLGSACRRAGVTAPLTDIIIAACASHHKLVIYHSDAHFHAILPIAKNLFAG
jgi:predicted nucleic acid-binding protein